MRQWNFICMVVLLLDIPAAAQTAWVRSPVADTSFTLHSAYKASLRTHPETRWVDLIQTAAVKKHNNVTYHQYGNRKLVTDVFEPAASARSKRTAIIIIHGGGWRSGNKSLHHPLAQQLALKGYVCFTPEYRLSTEALFPAAVHDGKAMVRWVRSRAAVYNLDTTRIVVAGHSAGGELAAFLGATNHLHPFEGPNSNSKFSSAVNAVVDMDGILAFIHPESGEGDDSKKVSAATQWFGVSKTQNPALWQQASPLTHMGPHMPPVLFINSGVARMHAGRDDFTKQMDRYGIYHEIKTFGDAPHSFPLFEPWFTPTIGYIDRFLQKIFPAGENQGKGSAVSQVWVADLGNGSYKNPVLHADYSDPDAIRVGTDYYMTASSFEDVPGLPILHSKDLVNWSLIGHALNRLHPVAHFSVPRHGEGVWAPSIRYHKNRFHIYYPDPDFGIYLVTAEHAAGPWSEPVLVQAGKGLIDPCPFWDEDGEAYLVHAFAGSRAGIKSVLVMKKLNSEGTSVIDDGVIVYDGHALDPTIEGPKIYKRNGWYYLFAPAGGVATGWQTVLRSKNIYGPYERKVVMDQGATSINGPHQGAWVTTQTGEDWFLHFQDKEAYGRVVHLQPMRWVADWPVIGTDKAGAGKGEPVLQFPKPDMGRTWPVHTPPESDEFNGNRLGGQWQWMGNPRMGSYFMQAEKGALRLYAHTLPEGAQNLWQSPDVLLQKFPAETFTATAKIDFYPNTKQEGEQAGLTVMGTSYAALGLKHTKEGTYFLYTECKDADKGGAAQEKILARTTGASAWLKVVVTSGGSCRFSYSMNGQQFQEVDAVFTAVAGKWKGAKMGLYCVGQQKTNDTGFADVDWFRVSAHDD